MKMRLIDVRSRSKITSGRATEAAALQAVVGI